MAASPHERWRKIIKPFGVAAVVRLVRVRWGGFFFSG
jgi:hypothetical protein